jgi:hypothetical protein
MINVPLMSMPRQLLHEFRAYFVWLQCLRDQGSEIRQLRETAVIGTVNCSVWLRLKHSWQTLEILLRLVSFNWLILTCHHASVAFLHVFIHKLLLG